MADAAPPPTEVLAWDAAHPRSRAVAYTLTTDANGCTTFKTTPSGRFGVNYNRVTGTTKGAAPCVTANFVSKVCPDGVARQSWDLNMRWDAPRDTSIANNYTTTSTGCQDFATDPSSRFRITYSGVTGPTSTPSGAVDSYVTITATLSNGQVLTTQAQLG